ncbi:hypothetical protein [Clostridium sporogenes]|uniref:hypothetical protein n=1 Tax=Clostridium sporogenes TaxID=1509 RepID=UPI002238E023|nr:hypothetical protein [Clostridium sporogenes]MCW6111704.1 hypothetical protein [Clostridium sporogenes]
MKKILSILMIICIILLVGCSGKKLNENEEITNGDIYNSITAISKNSNMKFVNDKENRNVLKVYIPIKGEDPKKINDEFKTIINSIMNKTSSVFKQYKNLEEIEFLLLLNGKESSEAIVDYMKRDGDKFQIYAESFLKEDQEKKVKEEKENETKEEAEKEAKEKAIKEENKATLITTAQEVVKKNLKAPSTAKFPWSFDEYKIKETNSENKDMAIYYVSGYVDAKNSFGAKLRNNFVVKMECAKDFSKYKVLDINITEQ